MNGVKYGGIKGPKNQISSWWILRDDALYVEASVLLGGRSLIFGYCGQSKSRYIVTVTFPSVAN